MAERLDASAEAWPLRPWILAAICAVAGLLFHLFTDGLYQAGYPAWRQAGATFVAVAALSFVVTVERKRWTWSLAFALAWGLTIAGVGWFTARYNVRPNIFEFPYLSGLFAVLLAAPLFQTVRDEGAWRFPYGRLHGHAWTDAVIGAASLFFTAVSFLLAWLVAGLFDVIGIDAVKRLLEEEAFAWSLAGFAFGGALGVLRERDRLAATLQRLVMVVLAVLAPVLAFALTAFLLTIPFTGLERLWDSWVSAAALLLAASAFSILLANAVIGDGTEDRSPSRVLRWSAMVLVAVVAPLAFIAALAMGIRIGAYGWTPERIWGAIAVGVAITYGLAAWWSIGRGWGQFDEVLRPLQTRLAIGLCGLALLLALPILDFGAISARSQIARLQGGKIRPDRFDWAAMAFDFGPAGRDKLRDLSRSGSAAQRQLAATALQAKERWSLAETTRIAEDSDDAVGRVRSISPDLRVDETMRRRIAAKNLCPRQTTCVLVRTGAAEAAIVRNYAERGITQVEFFDPTTDLRVETATPRPVLEGVDLAKARVEVRQVPRRQIFVDGKPLGEAFE